MVTRTTDVTVRDDLDGLFAAATEEFGRLDVLVSNAGVAHLSPVSDGDVDCRAAFAIDQPDDVEIGDMTIRPTAQG